ncbi:MAG: PKD domain-containing protein, partial [Bacteroidota bacterium]
SHSYVPLGVFNLVITAYGSNGCTNNRTYIVVHQTNPGGGLVSPGNTTGCSPLDVTFDVGQAALNNAPGTLYIFDFGDSTQITLTQNDIINDSGFVSHVYTATSCDVGGAPDLTAFLTIQNFCSSTPGQVGGIEVYDAPEASFEFLDSTAVGCVDSTDFCVLNTTIPGINVNPGTGLCSDYTFLRWDFGDGTILTGDNAGVNTNPCHSYSSPGDYTITLDAWNGIPGCDTSTFSRTIRVNAPPVSVIEATDSTGCVPLIVTFDGSNSTGGQLTYRWLVDPLAGWNYVSGFGDDSVITRIRFTDPGAYTVSLVTSNNCGIDTADFLVIVGGDVSLSLLPIPNACDSVTQFPTVVLDTAFGFLTNISWSFTGGTPSAASTVDPGGVFYGSPGTYTVTVSTITSCGTASDTETFSVFESPTAQFEADPVCQGDSTRFADLSIEGTGPGNNALAFWQWDFGDGTVHPNDTTPNPVHLYDTCGVYTVTLVLIDNNGCTHDTSLTVEVYCLPEPNFASDEVCEGGATSFTDLSIDGTGNINSWSWQLGAGQTSTLQNPQFLFDSCGNFNVGLQVEDDLGCRNTVQLSAYVLCRPEARFSVPAVCQDLPSLFTDTSLPGDTALTIFEWSLGDGTSGLGTPFSHIYDTCGTYSAQLIVTDANNCKDTANQSAVVYCLPKPGFEATTVCLGSPTTFTDTSAAGSGTLDSWTWDFGDGSGPVTQTSPAPINHTYPNCGFFVVTLTVGNTNGCTQTMTDSVFVRCLPVANFTATDVCEGLTTVLNDASLNGTGSINSWTWDFGGGLASTAQDTSFIFPTCGAQPVTLIVEDDLGCVHDTTLIVRIYCPPNAAFSIAPACEGAPSAFLDQTILGDTAIDSWSWDFGDGQTSVLPSPSNLYAACDTYNVRLLVTDFNGCQDSTQGDAVVFCPPVASFLADTVCEGNVTTFINQSLPASQYRWYFGDGDSSIQATNVNVTHTYAACGSYTARLIIGDGNSCLDTFEQTIFVRCLPTVDFQTTSVCAGETVNFLDQSSSANGGIVSWTWDFGDTNGDTSPNPNHIYSVDSSYLVTLTVSDVTGCTNAGVDSIAIFPLPITELVDTTVIICGQSILDTLSNYIVNVTDSGVWSGPSVIGNTWTTQSDSTLGILNPSLLNTGSFYTFFYTSTNAFGCQSSDSVIIRIIDAQPVDAGPDTTLCFDAGIYDLALISGSTGGTWFSLTGSVSSDGLFDVAASGAGTFTLFNSSGSGTCQVIDSLVVTVNPPLVVDAGVDSTIFCFGTSLQLNGQASGGDGNYTFSWTPSLGLSDPAVANPVVSGIDTSLFYFLTISDGLGCIGRDSIFVKENPA